MSTEEMREAIDEDRDIEIKLANLRNLFFRVDPIDVSVDDFVDIYLEAAKSLR